MMRKVQGWSSLLCNCSYQVTSVRSPRQVIDVLNAKGSDIDIILSEVDLPMTKGFKMLKYFMRTGGCGVSLLSLGLAEKNILNYDPELVASDPSDGNTNGTTLFSDDT